ncbi:hypothetical protein TR80_002490 [Xanthomonas campestris]|nr:hypothetical protein TR80_002490 [Xanthomonas campestris]
MRKTHGFDACLLQRLSSWKALFATSTAGLLRCPRANIHQVSASPPRCRQMFPATVQFNR